MTRRKRGRRRRRNANSSLGLTIRDENVRSPSSSIPPVVHKTEADYNNGQAGSRDTDHPQRQDDSSRSARMHYYNPYRDVVSYSSYYPAPYARPLGSQPPQSQSQFGRLRNHDSSGDERYNDRPQESAVSHHITPSSIAYVAQRRQDVTPQHQRNSLYHHHAASAPALTPTAASSGVQPTVGILEDTECRSHGRRKAPLEDHGPITVHQPLSAYPGTDGQLSAVGSEKWSLQSEGLALSVPVQCSHATLHSRFSTLLHQYWPERTAHNDLGDVWVRRAMSSKRFKKRDGSQSIELMCHTGPTPTETNDYQIQWLFVF